MERPDDVLLLTAVAMRLARVLMISGLSAFLTSTIPYTGEVVPYLVDMGLSKQFKVINGGTGTSNA